MIGGGEVTLGGGEGGAVNDKCVMGGGACFVCVEGEDLCIRVERRVWGTGCMYVQKGYGGRGWGEIPTPLAHLHYFVRAHVRAS